MQTWIHPSVRQGGSLLMQLWLIDYKGSRSLIKCRIEKERLAQPHQVSSSSVLIKCRIENGMEVIVWILWT